MIGGKTDMGLSSGDLSAGQSFKSSSYKPCLGAFAGLAELYDWLALPRDGEVGWSNQIRRLAGMGWSAAASSLIFGCGPFATSILESGGELEWPQSSQSGGPVHAAFAHTTRGSLRKVDTDTTLL